MPKIAKSYETDLRRYFCTDFNEVKVKNLLWKKNLEIIANFGNLQSGLRRRQICQFMEKYLKIGIFFNLREKKFPREKLKNFLNFRNIKMVSNVAEYANSWRNTKKFKLANFANFRNPHNSPKNCQICREIRKK